ncbi:MAG: protein kinase [Planctomycetia bacterium]|nr:protein kinase [Planctomycetia bacterium]
MAANDPANVEPNRPDTEELSPSVVREMAAAADQSAEREVSNESAWRVIGECADLLSRFWPAEGNGASKDHAASGGARPRDDAGHGDQTGLPQHFGRFEIRRALGHGGFGVVFLAFDPRLHREAALKVPRPEILVSPPLRQRFLREAQAAAVLDHPNIVPIYETGEIGPVGYILSAFCKGPTLASWFDEQRMHVGVRTAVEIVVQLAAAVQHAHSRGILHRDIKPANVLLEPAAEQHSGNLPFVPRLSDFGLAKRLDESTEDTRAGMILGTPQYMAPEQAAGEYREVGVETDVYGLGVILHELLTGQPPFVGRTDSETLHMIQARELSPSALRARRVPRDLETICLKCLEKNPSGRYQSARELADDLRRFLAGEAVSARAIGSGERFVRWCRRRPVVAALAMGLVLAIAAGSGTAAWQWRRAERNYTEARALLYSANMKLADAAWGQGNIRAVDQLLEPFAHDLPGPHELRGWEWYFLRRVCQQDPKTEYGSGQVQCLAQSPDGKTILVGTKEDEVWAYDVATGKKMWTLPGLSIPWAPSKNGQRMTYSGPQQRLSIRYVVCAAFDTACERLGAVDGSGLIAIWQLHPQPRVVCEAYLGGLTTAAAFDQTLSRAALARPDGSIHLWDANEQRDVGSLKGHTAKVISVAFSTDEASLLSGGEDGTVRLWNVAHQHEIQRMEHPRKQNIRATAMSGDGQLLAASADDNSVVIWRRDSPQPIADLRGHVNYIDTLAFSESGSYLATGSEDRTIRIWEMPTGKLLRVLRGHVEPVSQVITLRGSNELISGGADGSVKTWNPGAEDFAEPSPRLLTNPIALFSADGKRVVCQFPYGRTTLFALPDWKSLLSLGGTSERTALAYDSVRDRIATSDPYGGISLCDAKNVGQRTYFGRAGNVESLALSRNGKWLASGDDQTAKVWDIATAKLLHDFGPQPRRVHSVAFSPDSTQLAWSTDNLIKIGDPSTGRLLRTQHGHSERVYNVSYSPTGDRLASGDRFGTIIVWSASTGEEIQRLLGHTDRAYTCCFSPDGHRLVSCSRDGTIRWWDLSASRELLAIKGDWGPLEWVTLSPDGWTLLAIEQSGALRTWDPRAPGN